MNCRETALPSPDYYNRERYNSRYKKAMSEITLDETKLKELLKVAIFELLKEQKELFSELLTEALEDIGMENAIKEDENSETVSREQIFKILKEQPLMLNLNG